MIIHKITRQRIVTDKRAGDIVVDAQGGVGVSQESIKVIGGFKDYTGSGGFPTKELMYAGAHGDKLWGTDAFIDGARDKDRDSLGQKKIITRLRRKKLYIDLTK
ncbi:MAG: hypothetical protein IH948_00705 [Bacteroidetes bacterium]|nr:hypothetical protein [Bacteroidota bacterium]